MLKKFEYQEFERVEDAIETMMKYYRENELVNDTDKMEEIFYTTLGLTKEKSKSHIILPIKK